MNTKLKFFSISCVLLNLLPMAGYATNFACPSAQEVMNIANPTTGEVSMQTAFGLLTGKLVPYVFNTVDGYKFTGVGIPHETAPGQSMFVYCNYLADRVHPAPVPLTVSTTSVYAPAGENWASAGSYSTCNSQNNSSSCQFVEKH